MNRRMMLGLAALVSFAGCAITVNDGGPGKAKTDNNASGDDDDTTMVGDDDDDNSALGNCAAVISAQSDVFSGVWASVGDNEEAWLCDGANLSASGEDGRYYVESGAVLQLSGSNATVWAMDGAEVDVSGSNNVVVREPGARIDMNPGTELIECDAIDLDLSNAPAGGCGS